MTAASYDLPESVMKHIAGMSSENYIQTKDGFEIPLYFAGDLHRDSLENDITFNALGFVRINNIVALFNNGYTASNHVYGAWFGHGTNTSSGNNFAWVRSKIERPALRFIQQAISDFNGNYGAEYGVTAVAAEIYEE